jgi:hypothetical protein
MKKSQLKKLVLSVIVIMVFSSLIPATAAYNGRSTRIRPIEDWLMANNRVDDPPMGGMPDWEKGLVIWPHLVDHSYVPAGYYKPPLDCSYNGIVLEKELDDNKILVSILLHVRDAPFIVVTSFMGDLPSSVPVFQGTMQFLYKLQFTINLDTLGPDDYDEDGNILYRPWWWYVWVIFTLESVSILARGSGLFLSAYEGFEEGDTANMNTFVSMKVVGPDYTGSNPYYNFLGLFEITTVSRINFH